MRSIDGGISTATFNDMTFGGLCESIRTWKRDEVEEERGEAAPEEEVGAAYGHLHAEGPREPQARRRVPHDAAARLGKGLSRWGARLGLLVLLTHTHIYHY